MDVRRLKDDELYHHGVKGQRWGVRRYLGTWGRTVPITTGNSKGVHRRGEALNSEHKLSDRDYRVSHEFINGAVVNEGTTDGYIAKSMNRLSHKYDPSMKSNTFTMVGVSNAAGNPGRRIYTKDEASTRELTEVVKKLRGNNQYTVDAVNVNLNNLVQKYGTLEYDVNKYDKEYPYRMFTNISDEDAKKLGNHDIDEGVARKIKYTNLARVSEAKSKKRIAEGKKLVNKLKLFGESFKEVHSENISSGINFVKNLFNKEKHNENTSNKR